MTRRQLGRLAAGAAMLQKTPASGSRQIRGALDGFEDKVDAAGFDPVAYTRKLYESAPLELTFRAANRKAGGGVAEEAARQGHGTGGRLSTVARSPLQPQTLEVREFPGLPREKFVFMSRPGLGVLGYLLTPKDAKPPYAAMVCVPGHGRGVDDIVGIDEQGQDRTDKDGYQLDFAIQVVEHGMAAVAIEPMAFGCRRDPLTKRKGGLKGSACQPVAGAALLLGQTMIGWRVWDVMRTIDWIETRPELDAKRVGCMGISGGGTCTMFSAALEPRIKVAMSAAT